MNEVSIGNTMESMLKCISNASEKGESEISKNDIVDLLEVYLEGVRVGSKVRFRYDVALNQGRCSPKQRLRNNSRQSIFNSTAVD